MGQIRMDCSSPYAMASPSSVSRTHFRDGLRQRSRLHDRHGIVTPSAGLMNRPATSWRWPSAVCLTHSPRVASGMPPVGKAAGGHRAVIIDRVVAKLDRKLCEVPVGFKWFAPGLFDGSVCPSWRRREEACPVRQFPAARDGTVWTTDKDGPIMDLLAAEITARTGKDPGEHYQETRPAECRHAVLYSSGRSPRHAERRRPVCRKLSPEAVPPRHRNWPVSRSRPN